MSYGPGRISNGRTGTAVIAVHRVLWLVASIGAIASFVMAIRAVGQPDPLTGLIIGSALAPYVAARAWDELFQGE